MAELTKQNAELTTEQHAAARAVAQQQLATPMEERALVVAQNRSERLRQENLELENKKLEKQNCRAELLLKRKGQQRAVQPQERRKSGSDSVAAPPNSAEV